MHLAVGMPANERMDWLVEKATELGAAGIQPLVAERSVLRLAGERAREEAGALAGHRRSPPASNAVATGCRRSTRCMDMARWLAMRQGQELRLVLSLSSDGAAAGASRGGRRSAAGALGPGRRPHGARRSRPRWPRASSPRSLGPRVLRAETAPLAVLAALTLGTMNRNLWLLAICQGLFLTNNVTFIAINGLVGLALAPLRLDGDAAGDGLRGRRRAVHRHGGAHAGALRPRVSFQIGLGGGGRSRRCCARTRPLARNFWLLCVATVVAGYYNANAGLYRFAAAELAAPQAREKAVSLVMAGGLIGAVLGPNLAARTRDVFAGALRRRLRRAGRGGAAGDGACWHSSSSPRRRHANAAPSGRPLGEIMRQPVFIVAAAAGRARLRRDEPADGRHADRDAAVRACRSPTRRWCSNGT